MSVYLNGHFSLYLRDLIFMKSLFIFSFVILLFCAQSVLAQSCLALDKYEITKLTHVDCYDDNTGEINITLTNNNATHLWTYPDLTTTNNLHNLTNLYAGNYSLEIIELGDTCRDTIIVEQTIQIDVEVSITALCNSEDSGNVFIEKIWGGTSPYNISWVGTGNSDSTIQLPQGDHTLRIRDTNNCRRWLLIRVISPPPMSVYMQAGHVECKDDNTGSARAFITGGAPPFNFEWEVESDIIIEDQLFSVVQDIPPGYYKIKITDMQGCELIDSIEVKSNPKECIKIYSVFTPNGDRYHSYWHLEKIELYPDALIEIYNRHGTIVFRRRNYQNSESVGFTGRDQNNQNLPSGTYYYVVNLESEDEIFRGTVTILR